MNPSPQIPAPLRLPGAAADVRYARNIRLAARVIAKPLGRQGTMELRALELAWIKGREDDPADQCAHGRILFQVANFVRPEDGIWTVSAAGLFLLRTLELDHTAENPVSEFNFLIPHCGNDAWKNKGSRFNVVCMGCNQGRNPEVTYRHNKILVRTEQEQYEFVITFAPLPVEGGTGSTVNPLAIF